MKTHIITLVAAAGLLVGCNRSVESASQKFNELPPAVQKTVRAQAPNAEITDVSSATRNGMNVYEIRIRDAGNNSTIEVADDGKLLNSEMVKPAGTVERLLTPTGATGTKLSALPEKAQKTILSKAPTAQISNISRLEDNGRVIYEVEFADKAANPTIKVAEDGTIVQ